MNNEHVFALINAGPETPRWHLQLAVAVAQWLIYLIPFGMVVAWWRSARPLRLELLEMLLAASLALVLAQVVTHAWPQPRPFALHLGTQWLPHVNDPGLPSDHVTVFWALGFSSLMTLQCAVWGFPLLALGLTVGWSRVYLGVHFPYDVLAALPVAAIGAAVARSARPFTMPLWDQLLSRLDRWVMVLRAHRIAGRRT